MSSTPQAREDRRRASHQRVVRRRRGAAAGLLLLAVLIIVLVSSGGGSRHASTAAKHAGSRAGSAGSASVRLKAVVQQSGRLPAPVQDAAVAAIGPDSALLMGGLDQADTSVSDILRATLAGATKVGALPTALHDATASPLAGQAYLFGGGATSQFSGILAVAASGAAQPAGQLPTPASDVA